MTYNAASFVKITNTGFSFPILTKILGQPQFHTLQIIKRELTENYFTLETSLSPIDYAEIILFPFIYI